MPPLHIKGLSCACSIWSMESRWGQASCLLCQLTSFICQSWNLSSILPCLDFTSYDLPSSLLIEWSVINLSHDIEMTRHMCAVLCPAYKSVHHWGLSVIDGWMDTYMEGGKTRWATGWVSASRALERSVTCPLVLSWVGWERHTFTEMMTIASSNRWTWLRHNIVTVESHQPSPTAEIAYLLG